MIVRTYGRRGRSVARSCSGAGSGFEDGVSSQESPQDVYSFEFPSQDSGHWASSLNNSDPYGIGSSHDCHESEIFPLEKEGDVDGDFEDRNGHWKAKKKMKVFDWDPYSLNSSQESDDLLILPSRSEMESGDFGKSKKSKKAKENGVLQKKMNTQDMPEESGSIAATLMETQEHGEMMENIDEVNFALDGLRKGQPVRIRRASLLSLLSICGTIHQRRLLRAHGMAQTIVDAVLGLSSDDSSSNLAAAALFYIFISDGRDDHLLDSPGCICFLIKLLKPVKSDATVAKAQTIGSKLLAIRLDADVFQDLAKGTDSTSNSIIQKVQDILVNTKEMKTICDNDNERSQKLEVNPKWISLLTMEKACLSTISIEDTSGTVRKSGGAFKEKLRELGGLDAVFEVARNCHSVLEGLMKKISSSLLDPKDTTGLESLVLLLKCLKIMENATFLSMDNQNHLLQMKGKLDSLHSPRSFTKLILCVVGTLSGVFLHKRSSESFKDKKISKPCDRIGHASESLSIVDDKDSKEIFSIISSLSTSEDASSSKCFSESQTDQLGSSKSILEGTITTTTDSSGLKTRVDSSKSGSCSGSSGHTNAGTKNNMAKENNIESKMFEFMDDTEDPFAFDEDEFEPSKWDLMSGKQKVTRAQNGRPKVHRREDKTEPLPILSQQESSNNNKSSSCEASCSFVVSEEMSNLLADCLLTAVKVLMNLTNDNPIGCQQIAACGGLEALTCLIAGHFPSFNSGSEINPSHQIDSHLSDQELDFLVAILGLLVNLVEKDGRNRSRLAAASVSLPPGMKGLEEESCTDVIPLFCSIFLANQGAGEAAGEGNLTWDDEEALLKGEKEAEKMIVEAYSALLLAFLSTESKNIRNAIAECLPDRSLAILVPVLERFVEFHLSLNMISPETHSTVLEVIESCRIP